MPIASYVDIPALNPLAEIIVRAGDLTQPDAYKVLMRRYERDTRYTPVIYGLSTIFRQGASLTELAQHAMFPHGSLSVSFIAVLTQVLAKVKHGFILYITPTTDITDHHTLAVTQNGIPQVHLAEHVAKAIVKAFLVVENPFKS